YPWHRFEPHPEWVAWDETGLDKGLGELGHWVWFPEGDATKDAPVAPRYFRRAFEIDARPIRRARLRVGADDRFTAWVNGRKVGEGAGWDDAREVDVTMELVDDRGVLRPGKIVLAIRAENMKAPVALNPAGLIAGFEVEYHDGGTATLGTDGRWRS